MTDAYRPAAGRAPGIDRYRPSAGPPPFPRGPPPVRHFGEDSRRNSDVPSRDDFTFRTGGAAPRYPNRPPSPRARPDRRASGPRRGRGDGAAGRGRPQRGRRWERVATADRPLLKFQRGGTPEQLKGMNGDDQQTRKFVDLDDVSDSEEESMDESDSEGSDAGAPKRRKLAEDGPEDDTPKWSNPELYTSLPPLDDATERKRKDVVKLIRKARLSAAKETEAPAAVDDFIGFDFGSDEEIDHSVPDAPTDRKALEDPTSSVGWASGVKATGSAVPAIAENSAVAFEASVASRLFQSDRKRKREVDDIGLLREPLHKRGRGKFSGGVIMDEWKVTAGIDPMPWIAPETTFPTSNAGFRLHKEICDFFAFVKPRPFEQAMRAALLARLQSFIKQNFGPSCSVYAFGSFAAGLYLPNADMDLVVLSERFQHDGQRTFGQHRKSMYQLSGLLERSGIARRGSVEVVASAKVPIIKFVDAATHLHVDLSFENDSGIIANETFMKWKAQYPAMPVLVSVIKQFLMMRGLNNNATGGLGGFSVTCLVVSMLQLLPRVQLGEVAPERHLGEMLLEFLDYYGNQFDFSRTAILMDPPRLISKTLLTIAGVNGPNMASRLCIVDPNRFDNDISGGTKEIILIFRRFSEARQDILAAMRDPDAPCLLPLQGNYNDFMWHRYQLRQLYEKTNGPVMEDDMQSRASDIDIPTTESDAGTGGDSAAVQLARELKENIALTLDEAPSGTLH